MKRILGISLIAAGVLNTVEASSLEARIAALEAELATVKAELAKQNKQLKKQKKKINEVKAHDSNDNIKWGVDLRTSIDSVNYDMANGSSYSKNDLMALRLWLNMAYSPNPNNVFKGQLSMNKAFGADFVDPFASSYGNRPFSMGGMFDWTGNEALTDNHLKVRQAYWLYLGESAFGVEDMPWTFSIGRRPSTGGFLANLREDDPALSPLGHIINVEFDGLSSKLDLSGVTGIDGLSIKVCMGQGSTNAEPLYATPTFYVNDDSELNDIKLAGFIVEPYNDGQIVTKFTWFRAWDLPDIDMDFQTGEALGFKSFGDMEGAAFSVMIDGLTEDGYFADAKLFASYAWSKTLPDSGEAMLGSYDSETGTSYWLGAQLPVTEEGFFGVEYNHGSKYWRPFTYAEDTMIGSKLAVRGDAWETYFTWHINEALSAQIRYTKIDYDYTGSNGFFGNSSGAAYKIDDLKNGAKKWRELGGTADPASGATVVQNLIAGGMTPAQAAAAAKEMGMAAAYLPNVVESAQDLRFYIRYRF